jgi:hypothetical protein
MDSKAVCWTDGACVVPALGCRKDCVLLRQKRKKKKVKQMENKREMQGATSGGYNGGVPDGKGCDSCEK